MEMYSICNQNFKCNTNNTISNKVNNICNYFFRTNANIDLIVYCVGQFQELGVSASAQCVDCSAVDSLEVLEQCFSHFMAKGAAVERQISSPKYRNYNFQLQLWKAVVSTVFIK